MAHAVAIAASERARADCVGDAASPPTAPPAAAATDAVAEAAGDATTESEAGTTINVTVFDFPALLVSFSLFVSVDVKFLLCVSMSECDEESSCDRENVEEISGENEFEKEFVMMDFDV